MPSRKKILAISGSTRKNSTNLNLIKAISLLTADVLDISVFEGLSDLPHFNPDLDTANPPEIISHFRRTLREADGILICTPEYAMGVPGTLKNAIDWTVSSCEFSHKPVALITASSMGENAHQSLLLTLKIIEAAITDDLQLLISYAKSKVSTDNEITDQQTLTAVKKLIDSFVSILNQDRP